MPTITFHTNTQGAAIGSDPSLIEHTQGSGLGFFGGSFGISVPVGQYQNATYVCNANGTSSGVQASNTKYNDTWSEGNSGVTVNAADIGNSGLPNYQTPLNIRFTHDEGIRVQNCRLRIFDRNDINQHASGVTTEVYEARHPHPYQGLSADTGPLTHRGVAGEHGWVQYQGTINDTVNDMVLTAGPGPSGLNTDTGDPLPATGTDNYLNWISQSGDACRAEQHDWYIALSASPDDIGSKTDYGLYFTLEYL